MIEFSDDIIREDIALFVDSDNKVTLDYGEIAGDSTIYITNKSSAGVIISVKDNTYTMSDTAINQLIQDMSSYATEQGISLTSVEDVKNNADLMNMVNSAWTQAA